jgi:putative ABC transport system substrate-binding protein
VAWLAAESFRPHVREAFKSRGVVEGRDITLTFHEQFGFRDAEKADALVRGRPDIIVLYGDGALWPIRKRTRDIPIVFYNMMPNPVDFGLVESFARPGGNLTGSTVNVTEWTKKLFEIMNRLVPSLKVVAELTPPTAADFERFEPQFVARNKERIRSEKAQFGFESVEVLVTDDLRREQIAAKVRASGAQVVMFQGHSPESREYAISAPIPTVCRFFGMAKRGCLLGWSFDDSEGPAYAVQAVQRILRGDSPAVIPVYQIPIAYALNRRRARELGIEIPPDILIGAREVYE